MKYEVIIKSDADTTDWRIACDSFGKAKQLGQFRGKGHRYVEIQQKAGLQHGKPMRWRWFNNKQEWKPILWYDEYAAGKRPPKGSDSLFAS